VLILSDLNVSECERVDWEGVAEYGKQKPFAESALGESVKRKGLGRGVGRGISSVVVER
jgi:hypothetical protein